MTVQEIEAELQRRLDPHTRQPPPRIRAISPDYLDFVPRVLAPGFRVSMQASAYHYCSPRTSKGPWVEVELGFPSDKVEAFMPYCEGRRNPTETVYGYVPLSVVAQAIFDLGGLVEATWIHPKRPTKAEGRKGTKRAWNKKSYYATTKPLKDWV